MSTELDSAQHDYVDDDVLRYRALSVTAVLGLVFGGLSFLALFAWFWLAVPVVGAIVSLHARRTINAQPMELSGLGLAKMGLALSLLFGFGGPTWLIYEH